MIRIIYLTLHEALTRERERERERERIVELTSCLEQCIHPIPQFTVASLHHQQLTSAKQMQFWWALFLMQPPGSIAMATTVVYNPRVTQSWVKPSLWASISIVWLQRLHELSVVFYLTDQQAQA